MWDDTALKCWNWNISGISDSCLLDSGESQSPLWSPATSSSAESSDFWSPDTRYFNFNESELFPQGIQSSVSGQDLWDNLEESKHLRNAPQTHNSQLEEYQLSPILLPSIFETEKEPQQQLSREFSEELQPNGSTESDDEDKDCSSSSSEGELLELRCMWIDCKSQFDSQNSLVRHIDRFHVEGRKDDFRCFWHGCSRKNRPFNARYKLLIHMRVHTGHKPNQCNIDGCGKAFSRLENLKIHVRSHTGERPYVCHRCPKAFSNSSDRAKHQRTHIESKPYHCLYHGCNKKYTDPSSLRKHAKIHFLSNEFVKEMMPYESRSSKKRNRKTMRTEVNSLPVFSSIKQRNCQNSFEPIELMDFDPFLEPKCEAIEHNFLSDTDWMSSEELKDIDQILSF